MKKIFKNSDHLKGPSEAPYVIVEYSDFQSPACATMSLALDALLNHFRPEVTLVYRHFPLTKVHTLAGTAAVAAEAAGLQGKFWEMHDILFANQDKIKGDGILYLARDIVFDLRQFEIDLERPELAAKVRHDIESGVSYGVTSVPAVFLNGSRYKGDLSYDGLFNYLQDLKDQNKMSFL